MSEMKPCPFCGGEAQIIMYPDSHPAKWGCGCGTGEWGCNIRGHRRETREIAIAVWNTRPVEDLLRAEYTDLVNMYEADTNALRAELARVKEESRWIPVDERLPEVEKWVSDRVEVCVRGYKGIGYKISDFHCSYIPKDWNSGLSGDGWIYRAGWYPPNTGTPTDEEITHWRPVPPPPK